MNHFRPLLRTGKHRFATTRTRGIAHLVIVLGLVCAGCASNHEYGDGGGLIRTIQRGWGDDGSPRPNGASVVNFVPAESQSAAQARIGFQLTGFQTAKGAGPGQPPEVLPKPASQYGGRTEQLPYPEDVPTGARLSLDETIKQVLLADPKLKASFENIVQSEGDFVQSSLCPNPKLAVTGSTLPLGAPNDERATGGPRELDVGVSYPLDWYVFGKRAAAMASAAQDVTTSQFDHSDQIRQRVTSAALAFYDLLEAKALIEIARKDVDSLKQVEKATADAVKNGQRPAVDLYRVQLDLLKSQQTVRDAAALVASSMAKLRAFLGPNFASHGVDVTGDLFAPLSDIPLTVDDAYNLALNNRPDIQTLESKVAKAQADVRVEDREALPEMEVKFGTTREMHPPSADAPNTSTWNVELDLSLPVFNRNQGKRLKARSIVAESNYNLQTGQIELRSEIAQVMTELRTAYLNGQAVGQEQLALAKQVRDSIEKSYKAGARPLIDFLDAERNYRETYRLYINTRANYWRAVHRFNSALGKQVMK
jgi:cobalt-zinc-cadmium efflux system outer membrane protein